MTGPLVHDIVPPRRAGGRPAWCLVLHGLGDSKEGWKDAAGILGLDHLGFIFAQAPTPYGPGWSWFAIDPGFGANQAEVERSRMLLDALIGDLLARLGIGADRLAVLGFSQGCLMAIDQILHRPRVFAGVVAISGFTAAIPSPLPASAAAQRVLWTHGRFDQLIPIAWTRGEMRTLAAAGLPVDWREYDKDHGIDPEAEVADIRGFLSRVLPA